MLNYNFRPSITAAVTFPCERNISESFSVRPFLCQTRIIHTLIWKFKSCHDILSFLVIYFRLYIFSVILSFCQDMDLPVQPYLNFKCNIFHIYR